MKIKTTLQTNQKLSSAVKAEMWLLYQQFYAEMEINFYQKIKAYNYFSFFSVNGKMIGFMGIQTARPTLNTQTYLLCRFGQAVILEPYQGKGLLQRAVLKLSSLFWREVFAGKLICWGNAITYKSYLVFAKTAAQFYPNYRQPTPYNLKDVIDFIGTNYFATTYEASLGIVKQSTIPLRDNSNLICHKYKEDSNIRFFSEINPQYETGYGVITIALMNWTNIISLLKKSRTSLLSDIVSLNNRSHLADYTRLLVN